MKGAEMAKDNRRIGEMDLNRQIMNYFISKFLNGYIVIVCLIMFYELVMLIRGVFVFDFTYWRHLGYFHRLHVHHDHTQAVQHDTKRVCGHEQT